jgi:alkanesulfonate monooxygenase SsuD/methylene tetrahydromethanopterin reductase-like flavin-dependent oxidoreductase (luciferase family)
MSAAAISNSGCRVYAPLVTLAWIAGWTSRVGLGTSIVLVPLHHPIHLAKEIATLQELSGGRFTLGVGMGWHRDEYDFMGLEFEGRGRRADSPRAIRRARELGDAWHPSRGSDADHVRRVKEEHPELRVVPRTSPERVEGMLEAGAEGAVVSFRDERAMREFIARYR